jgi:methionine-rich copper-binding protein CopC
MTRRLASLAGALMFVISVVPPAGAWPLAPELVNSKPADKEGLHSAPTEVSLEFSEELDETASTIEVRNECGKRVDEDSVEVAGAFVSTKLKGDSKGDYTVRYEATGFGSFSGTATGEYSFTVQVGSTCGRVRGSNPHDGHGGSGNRSNDNTGPRLHSRDSPPSGTPSHQTPTTTGTSSSSDDSNRSSTSSLLDDGAFNDASSTPPLAAPTPLVTPTPVPTPTPAPAPTAEDQQMTLTASPQSPPRADRADVLIALAIVVLLGVLGGWVLRASAPR